MIIASCSNNNQPVASITMNVDIVKEGSHKAFTVYKGYKIYKDKGYDAYQKYFDATYVTLPDGKYIAKTELDKMPKGTQQILTTTGFAGLEEIQKPVYQLLKGNLKEFQNLYFN